jgi:molybdate transport system ATP-binding protein
MSKITNDTPARTGLTPAGIRFRATKMLHTARGPQLFDVTLAIQPGAILAITGPSGAGKTTLLRILAGLTKADTGLIEVNDARVEANNGQVGFDHETWLDTNRRIDLPTRHRSIGFVFQDFALFPHMTVLQQLAFALPKNADRRLIAELLDLMDLEALQHQKPNLLSGGQQQRVAIARAIARTPRLLLLDEPLSALDDEMRHKLQDYILKARQRFQLTILLVSHHLPEIIRLADSVITLDQGRIIQQGLPSDVFRNAQNASAVRLTATVIKIVDSGGAFIVTLDCAGATIDLTISAAEAAVLQPGQEVALSGNLLAGQIRPVK